MTTLAAQHAFRTLDKIVERFGLDEVLGADGGAWLTFRSQMPGGEECGTVRVFHGGPVHKLVTISLGVPALGLDSHMVFAFTAPGSAIPHFTLDSVQAPAGPPGIEQAAASTYAFHLDLIPRVDLGANLAYLDEVYMPIDAICTEARANPGLEPAHLNTRQLAIMSPWMLAYRSDEAAYIEAESWMEAYLDHWFVLVDAGLSEATSDVLFGEDFAGRDRANRSIIFDPDVDVVWAQVSRLVGEADSERARGVLADQDLPS